MRRKCVISVCWTLEHFYSILTIVWLSYPTLPLFFLVKSLFYLFFLHPPFHRHREVAVDPESCINSLAVELAEPLAFFFLTTSCP